MTQNSSNAQSLDDDYKQLQAKAAKLNLAAAKLNADIENAQDRYAQLQKQALDSFGTSDLNEIQKILLNMIEQNKAIYSKTEKEVSILEQEIIEKQQIMQRIKAGS